MYQFPMKLMSIKISSFLHFKLPKFKQKITIQLPINNFAITIAWKFAKRRLRPK